MKFASIYDSAKEREQRSQEAGFECVGDSLTVQADAKEADINFIMERYARTGQVPGLQRLPSYGDFDGISDFREALHAVRDAEDLFMQLPAKIRARMDNDPAQFVEFCEVPENREELADLGLLAPEVTRAVQEARQKRLEAAQEGAQGADRTRPVTAGAGRPGKAGKPAEPAEGG